MTERQTRTLTVDRGLYDALWDAAARGGVRIDELLGMLSVLATAMPGEEIGRYVDTCLKMSRDVTPEQALDIVHRQRRRWAEREQEGEDDRDQHR